MVIAIRKRWLVVVAIVAVLVLVFALKVWGNGPSDSSATPASVSAVKGGTVRVAVLSPPETTDTGDGGDTLKSLVGAQLFVAQPDGTWRSSLVKPGSDHTSSDGKSATFELRDSARWSDGSPITMDDLRRTADAKWVQDVQIVNGKIKVTFTQKFEKWRQLWSGSDAIMATDSTVSGGPYKIDSVISGLQTDLVPNPNWYGQEGGPFLDHIVLVVASDNVMGRQLLSTNQVDVYAPPVESARTLQLRALANVSVSIEDRGGSWTAIKLNNRLELATRQRLAASVARAPFVNALLANEAKLANGVDSTEGPWIDGAIASDVKAADPSVDVSLSVATSLAGELQRSLRTSFTSVGITPTFGASAETADVSFVTMQEGPNECWTCDFGNVDADLAAKADAGDTDAQAALTKRLRDDALLLPMWKASTVVGYTNGIQGIEANGFTATTTWNAVHWHR